MGQNISEQIVIRTIQPQIDLGNVADLIELCFRPYLDTDGYSFILQMRQTFEKIRSRKTFFPSSAPYTYGVVCYATSGQLIGNVTLFPSYIQLHYAYLVANVCVHPDFRGQGIARLMMEKAMRSAQADGIQKFYLQVRSNTLDAITLYKRLGFRSDALRTNWVFPYKKDIDLKLPVLPTTPQRFRKNRTFKARFEEVYPQNVAWNLNYGRNVFAGNFWEHAMNWVDGISGESFTFFDASRNLIGQSCWQPLNLSADNLWVIPATNVDQAALSLMLRWLVCRYACRKDVMVNFNSAEWENAFQAAGFLEQNELLWMSMA